MTGEISPKACTGQYNGFIRDSIIYSDYIAEVGARIEDLRTVLETSVGDEVLRVQGAVKLARQLQNIFDDLLANAGSKTD